MIELNIRRFGGRGASSSASRSRGQGSGFLEQEGETYEQYVQRTLNNENYLRENRPNEYLMRTIRQEENTGGKYDLDYWKSQGVEIRDSVPKGWVKREGSTTAPKGYSWYSNGKSLFSGEYKHMLVKDKKKK